MAQYALATSYAGEALLSGFNWFSGADPSHGFVSYQSRANAEAMGLYSVDEHTGVVRLGVDSTNVFTLGQGRPSIRLESKEAYNHGLFIADFLHMPPSQCGLWPAFWSYGPNWPAGGEVDIIEGANDQYHNILSAHTAPGCSVNRNLRSSFTGIQRETNCDIGTTNVGCGYSSAEDDTAAYGDGFNAANGGVYAMEWDSEYIKIWHFVRSNIPSDILDKEPDPRGWGLPDAIFGGDSCEIDDFFKDMSLVININFCGDWGNAIWGKTDGCGTFAPTCSEYVANNPEAFANAYWDVRYIDAYRASNASRVSSSSSSMPSQQGHTTHTTMTTTTTTTTTVKSNQSFTLTQTSQWNTTYVHKTEATSMSATIPASDSTSATLIPTVSEAPLPKNPIKIDDAAYLGCFGSSDGFKTFRQVKDSKDMTVDQCVKLCHDSMFSGVHDTQCFCADSVDANTRATDHSGGVCDHPCPGDASQYCGGMARNPGKPANITLSDGHHRRPASGNSSSVGVSVKVANVTDISRPFTNVTTFLGAGDAALAKRYQVPSRRAPAAPMMDKNILLTVYGIVKNETPPPPPPPMAGGLNVTRTPDAEDAESTVYWTVTPVEATGHPSQNGPGGNKFVDGSSGDSVVADEHPPCSSEGGKMVTETVRPTVAEKDCDCTKEHGYAQHTEPASPPPWGKMHPPKPSIPVDVSEPALDRDPPSGEGPSDAGGWNSPPPPPPPPAQNVEHRPSKPSDVNTPPPGDNLKTKNTPTPTVATAGGGGRSNMAFGVTLGVVVLAVMLV